jgi:hypothetical protein
MDTSQIPLIQLTDLDDLDDLIKVDQSDFFFPSFMKTIDTYNKTIRETDTHEKFEEILNKLADDPKVTPSRMETLCEMMVRDLVLVHNDQSFNLFLNVIHAVINMIKYSHSEHK